MLGVNVKNVMVQKTQVVRNSLIRAVDGSCRVTEIQIPTHISSQKIRFYEHKMIENANANSIIQLF